MFSVPFDEIASVVALVLDGPPSVAPYVIRPDAKGVFELGVESSEIETRFEQRAKKENLLGHVYLTHWTRKDDVPAWVIQVPKPARYRVEMSYGATSGGVNAPYTIVSGRSRLSGRVEKSSSGELVFHRHAVGKIRLQAGEQTLEVMPDIRRGIAPIEAVRLTPIE